MAIIKLTTLATETILEHGEYVLKVKGEGKILFNTNEMITASNSKDCPGSYITYKRALVDSIRVKETIEEIQELIKQYNQVN